MLLSLLSVMTRSLVRQSHFARYRGIVVWSLHVFTSLPTCLFSKTLWLLSSITSVSEFLATLCISLPLHISSPLLLLPYQRLLWLFDLSNYQVCQIRPPISPIIAISRGAWT